MAGSDYYSCDICRNKTFYDVALRYEKRENVNKRTGRLWPDGNVGDMVVICKDCANNHSIEIVKK